MPPPPPLQVDNIFVFIHQVAGLFRHVGYLDISNMLTFDHLTMKVVSESRGDVGYLCANFSLPRPLCSRLRPNVRDRRQTSDSIIAKCPRLRGGA